MLWNYSHSVSLFADLHRPTDIYLFPDFNASTKICGIDYESNDSGLLLCSLDSLIKPLTGVIQVYFIRTKIGGLKFSFVGKIQRLQTWGPLHCRQSTLNQTWNAAPMVVWCFSIYVYRKRSDARLRYNVRRVDCDFLVASLILDFLSLTVSHWENFVWTQHLKH